MKSPDVVHPKRFSINGMLFEIVSHSALTDDQARAIAITFYRSHTFLKLDKGKLFRVLSHHSENS